MKHKAIIFDWSGTLIDNFQRYCKICDLMFEELGKEPISPQEIKYNFTTPYMKFWNTFFPDLTRDEQCLLFNKFTHAVEDAELYPTVEKTLSILYDRGWHLSIISSDPLSKISIEIEKTNLAPILQEVIGDVHEKKDSILSLIEKYNLDKEKCFYVGDTDGDIQAGKEAGIKTMGISWGFQTKDRLETSQPDYLIDDITEILDRVNH